MNANGEYQVLARQQETAASAEEKARERVEELDRRRWAGDKRVTLTVVREARDAWMVASRQLVDIASRMRTNRNRTISRCLGRCA
jgi:hypothetical protein